MLDTPSILMTDLARIHQEDLARGATEATQPRRRVRPVARVRWWTGQVIIRAGQVIGGLTIAAHPETGVADEHGTVY